MDATRPPAQNVAPSAARRLDGLDALRGIAALSVVHFHLIGIFAVSPGFASKGYLAVDFFFALSGYVMARTYEHRLAAGYGAARFIAARYRRLWPIMALGVLLGAPLVALEYHSLAGTLRDVVPNLLLIPALGRTVLYPTNSPAWSILAELSVNLLHGLWLWRLRTRQLALLTLATMPAIVWIAAEWGGLDTGAGAADAYTGILRALYSYTLGIVLWRTWRDRPPLRLNPFVTFAALPLLLIGLPMLGVTDWLFDVAFVLLASPLLIAGGLALRGDHSLWRWLGAISFPVYAINMPLLFWSDLLGLGPVAGVAGIIGLASYLALRTPAGKPAALAQAAA